MCFLVVGNVETDIVRLRQHNILIGGILSGLFDLRVKLHQKPFHQIFLALKPRYRVQMYGSITNTEGVMGISMLS